MDLYIYFCGESERAIAVYSNFFLKGAPYTYASNWLYYFSSSAHN